MKITRRALLISNPGEVGAENYCKGVFQDIANYKRFLCAAHGGWWKANEIVDLYRKTKAEVRQAVKELGNVDYSFIGFAGHGWFSEPDGATVVTLRKSEELSSLELLSGATKRTVVLDCCRKIHNESALTKLSEDRDMAFSAEAGRRTATPQLCRDKFDLELSNADDEIVILHSSTPPEKSGDNEVFGGHYTSSLVGAADRWARTISENWFSISDEVISVVAAHEAAATRTSNLRAGKQNPYIEKPRTGPYFPFSVFA